MILRALLLCSLLSPTLVAQEVSLVEELRAIRELLERNAGVTRVQAFSESVSALSGSLRADEAVLAEAIETRDEAALEVTKAERLNPELIPNFESSLELMRKRLADAEARRIEVEARINVRREQLEDLEKLLEKALLAAIEGD